MGRYFSLLVATAAFLATAAIKVASAFGFENLWNFAALAVLLVASEAIVLIDHARHIAASWMAALKSR